MLRKSMEGLLEGQNRVIRQLVALIRHHTERLEELAARVEGLENGMRRLDNHRRSGGVGGDGGSILARPAKEKATKA
jgi:hypothetical protein